MQKNALASPPYPDGGAYKGPGERPIRPCRLFDNIFLMCFFLKYNENGLNFDFMHHFHTKMSLFGLCTVFSKVTLFSLPEVFCGPQICKKCVGFPPYPDGGAYNAPPDALVGWEGGHPSPIPTPLGAFGTLILAPSGLRLGRLKMQDRKLRDQWAAHLDQRATDTTGKWGTKFPR